MQAEKSVLYRVTVMATKDGYYVYRYMHPDYPWLYIGKTKHLDRRIREHARSNGDNIDPKYRDIVNEAYILYIRLSNQTEMDILELYLIDKYKPKLNRASKYSGGGSLKMRVPKWEKYDENIQSLSRIVKKEDEYKHYVELLRLKIERAKEDNARAESLRSEVEKKVEHLNSLIDGVESLSAQLSLEIRANRSMIVSSELTIDTAGVIDFFFTDSRNPR